MRTHIVRLNQASNYNNNWFGVDVINPTTFLRNAKAKHNPRATFDCFVPEDVDHPEGVSLIPQAAMITDSPRKQAKVVDAEIGDHVVTLLPNGEAREYKIVDDKPLHDPRLEYVTNH